MKRNLMFATLVFVICSCPVLAQNASPQEIRQRFVEANKANTATARQYTWKSRTELKLKGESKKTKLEQVRYGLDGKLEKTPLGDAPQAAQQAPASGGRGGRVKNRVVEKKKEEFADMLKDLAELVTSYAHLPQEKLQAFVQGATQSPGQGTEAGTIQIAGKNALQAGDSMTIWISKSTLMFHRVVIDTIYDKKPVKVVCEFRSIPSGPNYMAKAVLDYPEKQVQVIVENFDYAHSGS